MTPLEKAISLVDGQSNLAKACETKQANVWNWLHRDGKVPAEFVIPVARATRFQVLPHQLRPDIYPRSSDGVPEEFSRQSA